MTALWFNYCRKDRLQWLELIEILKGRLPLAAVVFDWKPTGAPSVHQTRTKTKLRKGSKVAPEKSLGLKTIEDNLGPEKPAKNSEFNFCHFRTFLRRCRRILKIARFAHFLTISLAFATFWLTPAIQLRNLQDYFIRIPGIINASYLLVVTTPVVVYSAFYFHVVCQSMRIRLRILNGKMEMSRDIGSREKKHNLAPILVLIKNHNQACESIFKYNQFWKNYYFIIFLTLFLLHLLLLHISLFSELSNWFLRLLTAASAFNTFAFLFASAAFAALIQVELKKNGRQFQGILTGCSNLNIRTKYKVRYEI